MKPYNEKPETPDNIYEINQEDIRNNETFEGGTSSKNDNNNNIDIKYEEQNIHNSQEINDNFYSNDNYSIEYNYTPQKKSRKLQFYKFLFYSIKTEIKVNDFLKLIRTSNYAEIPLWVLSIIIYYITPIKLKTNLKDGSTTYYKITFIWVHIVHVFRAILGIFLLKHLPKSHEFIDDLNKLSDDELTINLFNSIIREKIYNYVIEPIKRKKILIFIYIGMTLFNFLIDLVDFLSILANISKATTDSKVIFLTYLLIAVLYLVIDLGYFFWMGQLRYVFPEEYLKPLHSVFNGMVSHAISVFKLQKRKKDVIEEAKIQNANGPYVKYSIQNGGVNILEGILRDSFGVYRDSEFSYSSSNSSRGQFSKKENYNYDKKNLNNNPFEYRGQSSDEVKNSDIKSNEVKLN